MGVKLCFEDGIARRHALQHRVHGRDNHRRAGVWFAARKRRNRRQPRRLDIRLGRYAVVRQAVPGWKIQHRNVRREEGKRIQCAALRRIVGGDEQHQPLAAARGFGGEIRVIAARRAGDGEAALMFRDVTQAVQVGDFRLQMAFSLSKTGEA